MEPPALPDAFAATLRGVQALLSLRDPVAGCLRVRLLPRQRVLPGAVQRGEHAGQ
jgi:hypothetical protein